MKTAIVVDWLVVYAGAERVLEHLLACYPNADLFAIVDVLPDNQRGFLNGKKVTTSFIQKLPFVKRRYRAYLPFMPLAIEQLDVTRYDLVISSSHAVAKGVITGPNQIHISYVHSPMRYVWDLQHQYLQESGLARSMKSWLARYSLHKLRLWDYASAARVDYFVANSQYIARRIHKVYRRDAEVIYPPVDVEQFSLCEQKENFYLTASRMVPYKRIPLIVEAFRHMPDKQLVVIGDGPELEKVRSFAMPNIRILGYQSSEVLKDYLQKAKAFVFAAIEDFGILPVEAQACGTPVIAYAEGGALETVTASTGVFFATQTVEAIMGAVLQFEQQVFDPDACRRNALRFSSRQFQEQFVTLVNQRIGV